MAVTYAQHPVNTAWLAPQPAAPPGALLPILDAELVAIDGVPVRHVRVIRAPRQTPEPHRLNPWHNPEPWLLAAKFSIPLGITGCIVWGFVDLVGAVTAHAADIAHTAEYAGLAVLGLVVALALLRGGKGGCAGLHCGGCRG